MEQKNKGVGGKQAGGLEWPTKRQRLSPKGNEELQQRLQKGAGLEVSRLGGAVTGIQAWR